MTASFFSFFVITFLIVVHELGHFLMAWICGARVEKILIYPLGGISKFSTSFNISLVKEFLILLLGPLFQFIACYFLLVLFPDKEGPYAARLPKKPYFPFSERVILYPERL